MKYDIEYSTITILIFSIKPASFKGEVDDEDELQENKDWYEYWRILFAKVSVKDIEEFEVKYKGIKQKSTCMVFFFRLLKI